jgi:hypothetical protein
MRGEIKLENKGNPNLKISIIGFIDESINLADYPLKGAKQVDFYLGKMKGINSCGIREWVKWMDSLGTAAVNFYECPKAVVDQINMVRGFLPKTGNVKSFYVPYYSDEAGTEKDILLTVGVEVHGAEVKLPKEVKDPDGNLMELDVVKDNYFKFLTRRA